MIVIHNESSIIARHTEVIPAHCLQVEKRVCLTSASSTTTWRTPTGS